MTCAKKIVKCTLIATDGERYVGENACDEPQTVCPRLPGEGYEKCKSICHQPGHAEVMALEAANAINKYVAQGARAYIEGIGHACKDCQQTLFAAGIASLTIGPPPEPGVKTYEQIEEENEELEAQLSEFEWHDKILKSADYLLEELERLEAVNGRFPAHLKLAMARLREFV